MFLSGLLPPAASSHFCSLSGTCETRDTCLSLLAVRASPFLPDPLRTEHSPAAQLRPKSRPQTPTTQPLCHLPLYLDEQGVAPLHLVTVGLRPAAKTRSGIGLRFCQGNGILLQEESLSGCSMRFIDPSATTGRGKSMHLFSLLGI